MTYAHGGHRGPLPNTNMQNFMYFQGPREALHYTCRLQCSKYLSTKLLRLRSSLGIKEISQSLVDEGGVSGAGAPSSKVAPHTGNHPQLCVGHVTDLVLLIGHREVQVYECWHDDRLCLHASQRVGNLLNSQPDTASEH